MPHRKESNPNHESNFDGFQDVANQFVEMDPILNTNDDDANFFDFPIKDNVDIFGLQCQ